MSAFAGLHDVPALRAIPLPKTLLIPTCISLLVSFILLVVSLLDLAQRKRRVDSPSYFSTCITCAYFLAVLWLAAFSVTTMVLVSWKSGDFQAEILHQQQGLPVTVQTQRLQCFLAAFEFLILGGIAVKGHLILRRKEGDPRHWRRMYDDDLTDR
ncbi:hypothetical protein DFH07DRAFT_302585 [Mycena maculata]|uniref:Uncharacterized protein n=1 Tax=Mycena maculata TaxID=230809 RepID=A0AAD7HJE5_9AGAR|nr:hypothetical protein DFH07DRAFT_302585 [Mycena maculata]